MPFTTVSKVSLDMGSGGPKKGYFHPEDISIILSQNKADVAVVVNAIVAGVECKVLLGATGTGTDGYESRLDGPDHLVALLCPPFTIEGGVFTPDPQPVGEKA